MDVIVIIQKNGEFLSTPFHIRFGAFKIMKVKDIQVSLEVNGLSVPIKMNLAEDGHAFFLKEDFNRSCFR